MKRARARLVECTFSNRVHAASTVQIEVGAPRKDRGSGQIQPVDATHFYGALEVKPLCGLLSVGQLSPLEGAASYPPRPAGRLS